METKTEESKRSFLIVEFSEPGSALFQMNFENVNASQLFALAGYLEFRANMALSIQERERMEQEQMRHIAKPTDKILVGR